MKRNILILLLFKCLNVYCQGQNDVTHLPNVMPVSPKSFEIQKYIDVPVGKYTGVPVISIPVYNIKVNGIELPITLSYHSNGVKVNEEASWVGLGWSLFAGGSITQIVKGYDDFGIFKWRDNEAKAIFDACKLDPLSYGDRFDVWITRFAVDPVTPGVYPNLINFNSDGNIIAGTRDVEPDLFKFNMLGYSGEFILDWKNNQFKCITDKNILIQTAGTEGGAFIIKTPDGNVFEFQNVEETVISGVHYENSNAPGADLSQLINQKSSRNYQLTTIYTSKGDKIKLNYLAPTALLENMPTLSASINSYVPLAQVPLPTSYETFKTINYSKQSFCYLSSIEFPNGSINFNSSDDRVDFAGTRKLNTIVVKNKSGTPVKSFSFNYDYFNGDAPSNGSDKYLLTSNYDTRKTIIEQTYRLKLLSFQESGVPPYNFEYNQTKLPKKTSYAYDHWGYYNGKIDSDLFPVFQGLNYKAINLSSPFDIVGINRSSNLPFTQASILNKIYYPTGGVSTFQYESNSFDNFKTQDDAHSTTESVYLSDNNTNGSVTSRAYIVDAGAYSNVEGENLNLNTYGSESVTDIGINTYIRLTILKKTPENAALMASSGSYLFWSKYFSVPLGQLSSQINGVISDSKILSLDFNQTTQKYETFKMLGNYHLDVDPDKYYIIETHLYDAAGPQSTGSSGSHSSVSGYFHINKNRPYSLSEASQGAGLRVKQILLTDNAGWTTTKDYNYTGGVLMGPIRYLKTEDGIINGDISFNNKESILGYLQKNTVNCSSFFPPSTSGSGHFVGYDLVTESNTILDNYGNQIKNANGSIIDHYTNQPDQFTFATKSGDYLFVYPPEKNPMENGLPLVTTIIDKNGLTIKRTENFYQIAPVDRNTWTYSRLSTYAGSEKFKNPDGTTGSMPVYSVGFYPIFSKKTLLDSTTITIFKGGQKFSASSAYQYDSHEQVQHSWEKTSTNKILHTYNMYPYNFNEGTPSSLAVLGIVSPLLEQKIFKDNQEIFHSKSNYQIYSSDYPVYTIQKMEKSFDGLPLETKVTYSYGNRGDKNQFKVLQVNDFDRPTTNFVWGYNGQYPVAEILGSDDNTIRSLINQVMLDNAADYTPTQIRTELNNLRIALTGSNAQVTTYTYDPLIGMTSMTDAKGQTTYYEYDSLQRLVNVKDQNGKIIKHTDYHYQGQ